MLFLTGMFISGRSRSADRDGDLCTEVRLLVRVLRGKLELGWGSSESRPPSIVVLAPGPNASLASAGSDPWIQAAWMSKKEPLPPFDWASS